jgi:hypothetical protein
MATTDKHDMCNNKLHRKSKQCENKATTKQKS